MRALVLAAGLIGLIIAMAAPASAADFEIEEETLFAATGTETARAEILSTADTDVMRPVIEAFLTRHPGLAVRYTVANSQEVFAAIAREGARFDLVISSAMDLQMKLANDGLARPYASEATARLPRWARWQGSLFAFAQEDVVVIASHSGLKGGVYPQTRRDLIEILRDDPERFRGRIGTYDPERSGLGYSLAAQDARQSDSFWRLAEVMGSLGARLYSSSNDMITDLKRGRLVLAYNVLGSYAAPRLRDDPDSVVIELEDYTLTLLRTALIPRNSAHPEQGAAFLEFLLSPAGQGLLRDKAGLPPIDEGALAKRAHLRPIRLDPGLLVFLDRLNRRAFLDEWTSALSRN